MCEHGVGTYSLRSTVECVMMTMMMVDDVVQKPVMAQGRTRTREGEKVGMTAGTVRKEQRTKRVREQVCESMALVLTH